LSSPPWSFLSCLSKIEHPNCKVWMQSINQDLLGCVLISKPSFLGHIFLTQNMLDFAKDVFVTLWIFGVISLMLKYFLLITTIKKLLSNCFFLLLREGVSVWVSRKRNFQSSPKIV
jgi:hypothetical protein